MAPSFRNRGPLGSSTNSTGGRLLRPAGTGAESPRIGFAVRFGRTNSGEPVLVELENGKRLQETTFETENGRTYYRKGDLIGRGKLPWKKVVEMYPEFSKIEPPITEDPDLKTIGLLTGELPEYEVGMKIEDIIPAANNRYEGTVYVRPYVMLTPEQSGEEANVYFQSQKLAPFSLHSSGGTLNQLFVSSRMAKRLDSVGGGLWFGRISVAIAKEVLSQTGKVFTEAAQQALKHALGVGAKKLARKYAQRYINSKGREAAVKRMVRKVFARLTKAAALFEHAATQAAIAFIKAFATNLLHQTKKNVRLLAVKGGKGTKAEMVSTGSTAEVQGGQKPEGYAGGDTATLNFSDPAAATINWKGAFWEAIVQAANAAIATVIGNKIAEHMKFNTDLDNAFAKELGDSGLQKGIEKELEQAFLYKLREELWTNSATMIIDVVGEVAGAKDTNANNFTDKLIQKLKDKLIDRLKNSFGGIPAMIAGQ